MKSSLFATVIFALFGAHMAAARCCSECSGHFDDCMDKCLEDEDKNDTVCGKICYGPAVCDLFPAFTVLSSSSIWV